MSEDAGEHRIGHLDDNGRDLVWSGGLEVPAFCAPGNVYLALPRICSEWVRAWSIR